MKEKSLNKLFEESVKKHWDRPSLSDYRGATIHYRDMARKIEKLHIIFESVGLKKGDKVSLCSRNQASWGIAFMATLTYGAVPVPILHEFSAENIHYLVNHSESKILFAGSHVWDDLVIGSMPALDLIMMLDDFSLIHASTDKIVQTINSLNELFGKRYPKSFTKECVDYHRDYPNDLALINYTSGTSGFSKGVMLPYRSLYSNVLFAKEVQPQMNSKASCVSMLPSAHAYGFMFEFFFEMFVGAHVHFLNRLPSPKIITEAFKTVKPDVIISVPLVIEKIYKKKLEPMIERRDLKLLLRLPVINVEIHKRINQELNETFGGKYSEVIIGGAAFNRDAENFFKKIGFKHTVGYGMTECGPIITYAPWSEHRLHSCGRVVPRMQIKIDSYNQETIPGEILVKGDNVFMGYYKNEEATKEAFTEDGWFRTGDLGVIDSDGFLYIKGRSKSMILGASGQNIYPEEIESEINNMPYVCESLVREDAGKLEALIYPDMDKVMEDGLSQTQLHEIFTNNIKEFNQTAPAYNNVINIRIFPEEFAKTPKKSIKRYLYQRKTE